MKALVIGGTGPVGPHVISGLLQRGYEVTILHRGTHEVDLPPEVKHIHGDPHFVETLEKALGGLTFDLAVGMYGRLRLVAQVLRGKTRRFISVGGIGVYKGWMNVDPSARMLIPTPEDSPLQDDPQVDVFTYRMVEAEQAVMAGHREGHYRATHFRFPMIYGPRQVFPREWSIIRRILDGRTRLILPDGGLSIQSRGYTENVAHALLLAADKPGESAGQIYNVSDETLLSVRDWVEVICRVMGHRFEFVEMPYSIGRPGRIYSARPQHHVLDITKAQRDLGYHDLVATEQAIELTVKWYFENRLEPGGEIERKLGDPFDYDAEDQLMDEFVKASLKIKEMAPPRLGFHHPYSHPKRPDEEAAQA